LLEERSDHRDRAAAHLDQLPPRAEDLACRPLGRAGAMRRAIPAAPIRFGQGRHVAAVGFDLALQLAIHRRVIAVGHDDFVAGALERLCHPFTFGSRLEQDPHRAASLERPHQPLARRHHALIAQDRALRVDDPNQAMPHVQIDGTIDHGWLLLVLSALFLQGDTPFVERKLPR
jgi:hypothetical protein